MASRRCYSLSNILVIAALLCFSSGYVMPITVSSVQVASGSGHMMQEYGPYEYVRTNIDRNISWEEARNICKFEHTGNVSSHLPVLEKVSDSRFLLDLVDDSAGTSGDVTLLFLGLRWKKGEYKWTTTGGVNRTVITSMFDRLMNPLENTDHGHRLVRCFALAKRQATSTNKVGLIHFDCKDKQRVGYLVCQRPLSNPKNCYDKPCLHGGTCADDGTGSQTYRCKCANGYEGKRCENKIDPCDDVDACFNGVCVYPSISRTPPNQTYYCQCDEGFIGDRCEFDKRPCAAQPCKNNGLCLNIGSEDFECNCSMSYTGKLCENSIFMTNDPTGSAINNSLSDPSHKIYQLEISRRALIILAVALASVVLVVAVICISVRCRVHRRASVPYHSKSKLREVHSSEPRDYYETGGLRGSVASRVLLLEDERRMMTQQVDSIPTYSGDYQEVNNGYKMSSSDVGTGRGTSSDVTVDVKPRGFPASPPGPPPLYATVHKPPRTNVSVVATTLPKYDDVVDDVAKDTYTLSRPYSLEKLDTAGDYCLVQDLDRTHEYSLERVRRDSGDFDFAMGSLDHLYEHLPPPRACSSTINVINNDYVTHVNTPTDTYFDSSV